MSRLRTRALALAALATVLVTVLVLATRGGGPDGQQVVAQFESTMGLIKGAPVKLGGVPVGKVESVTLGSGDVPEAVLHVGSDVVLHEGMRADLRLDSQAGQLNRFVEITTGQGRELPERSRLPLASTDQPVELDDALSGLTPDARDDVRSIVAALDDTLKDNGGRLSATLAESSKSLKEVAGLADVLADDAAPLSRLVTSSNKIVAALAADPDGLQSTADQLAATLRVTASRQREIASSVDELAPSLKAARSALDNGRAAVPELEAVLNDARPAAAQARKSAPQLAAALQAAPEALAAAEQLAVQAPGNLKAMRPVTKQAAPVVKNLPAALDKFLPILDQMRARAPDALGWLPLLGDALANYDENGHGGQLMLVLGTPPNTPVKADENKAGLLEAPYDRTPGSLAGEPWTTWRDSLLSTQPKGGK